jgi:hypothetical protein
LCRLGVNPTTSEAELHSPEVVRWRTQVRSGSSGAYFWFSLLEQAPSFTEAASIVGHAVWPTNEDLLLAYPDVPDRAWPRLVARAKRARRAARAAARVARTTRL